MNTPVCQLSKGSGAKIPMVIVMVDDRIYYYAGVDGNYGGWVGDIPFLSIIYNYNVTSIYIINIYTYER